MNGNRLGFLALLALFGVLLLATAGCLGPARSPTPTTWYLVITNTPPPSSTPPLPASPTAAPSPTASPAPTATATPAPTPPPLPTSSPTRLPTASPPPPTATYAPPPPTEAPTLTPVPTAPPQDVCQGDEEMTFEPKKPGVGDKLTITVTSAKAHENVRLEVKDPRNPGTPGKGYTPDKVYKDDKKGLYVWIWRVEVTKKGRLSYTFYVGDTPCTAKRTGET